jgi:hypothetical protein
MLYPEAKDLKTTAREIWTAQRIFQHIPTALYAFKNNVT